MNKSSYDPLGEMFTNLNLIGAIFFIVVFIFFVIGIAYIVRLWFVQSATFQMQKDLAEIRDHLMQSADKGVDVAAIAAPEVVDKQDTTSAQSL